MMLADAAPGIDWKISIDTLLTIGGFIVAITIYVTNMRSTSAMFALRLKQVDDSITAMQTEIKRLNEVIINQALQHERLNNMEQRGIAQGKRLDDVVRRFDDFLDQFHRSSLSPMRQSAGAV